MAIFGTIDAKALANNLSVTNGSQTVTTTGDFTDKTTANYVRPGDVLSLSGVQYTVVAIDSATSLRLTVPYAGSTGTITAANAIRRTPPKEVAEVLFNENGQFNHYPAGTSLIFIDNTEAQLTENKVRGFRGPGWYTYRTYTDGDGNTRHKTECIAFAHAVAGAAVGDYGTADGGTEDNPAADVTSTITISGQPSNQSTYTPSGGIRTFNSSGTAAAGTGSYTAVAGTGGAGTGATFNVSRSGGTYTVTLAAAGSGYGGGNTITIPGASLGGTTPTNNLSVVVSTVASAAATFSVTASVGTGTLTYQWQRQAATGTSWSNISGATSSSLALTGLTTADSGKKYRVKVGGSAGGIEVISDTATLTVTAA